MLTVIPKLYKKSRIFNLKPHCNFTCFSNNIKSSFQFLKHKSYSILKKVVHVTNPLMMIRRQLENRKLYFSIFILIYKLKMFFRCRSGCQVQERSHIPHLGLCSWRGRIVTWQCVNTWIMHFFTTYYTNWN